MLEEIQQHRQLISHYLQQHPQPQCSALLLQLEQRPLSYWPELLHPWMTPELKKISARLEALQAAISLIDMGLYGLCSDCECRIESELLTADPTRQRCRRCEQQFLGKPPHRAG
jgi:hypothetical protein